MARKPKPETSTSRRGKETFGALPARMMSDETLSASDLRIALAISAHDRFGASRGCIAGRQRLAAITRCDLSTVTRSINRLIERGYVTEAPNQADKRRRVYRMVFSKDDSAFFVNMTAATPTKKVANPQPISEPVVTVWDSYQVANPQPFSAEIGCNGKQSSR